MVMNTVLLRQEMHLYCLNYLKQIARINYNGNRIRHEVLKTCEWLINDVV